jgi:hypothetical protein
MATLGGVNRSVLAFEIQYLARVDYVGFYVLFKIKYPTK